MVYRVIYNILILISVFYVPFWIFLILLLIGLLIYRNFFEAIFWTILADNLFSLSRDIFFNFQYIYTLIILIMFLIINFFKKKIR